MSLDGKIQNICKKIIEKKYGYNNDFVKCRFNSFSLFMTTSMSSYKVIMRDMVYKYITSYELKNVKFI